jgi:pyruvate/2-oxoacid:ferredoxin oxidoreductase alpha subunit
MSRSVTDGAGAAAEAVKLCRVGVICAYPITPSSAIVEKLALETASGRLPARFVEVESEQSSMGGLIGASQTGARTFTATSSQGLAYMHELLHWAAGGRLPIVMVNANRAMALPWSLFCDHQDSMSQRDTGWMQIYVESCQEIADTLPLAYRLAEALFVPCMVSIDGFVLSHTTEAVEMPSQEVVDAFLPRLSMPLKLDLAHPRAFGAPILENTYHEVRADLDRALHAAAGLADELGEEWRRLTGRAWPRLIPYEVEDAEIVVMSAGTLSGTVRHAVRELRQRGERVGALSVRFFRPFPADLLRSWLPGKRVLVLDRAASYGQAGPIATEVRAATADLEQRPEVYSLIAGLGGRDVTDRDVARMVGLVREGRIPKEGSQWYGLRTLRT